MNCRLTVLILSCAVAIGAATARADGPPQGIVSDGSGITSPDGTLRYLAADNGHTTLLQAIRVHDGTLMNEAWFEGAYAIPAIAWTATGLTANGKTLVLTSYPWTANPRFAVVGVPTFDHRRVVRLRGHWAYDAISPDGRTLFLIQYLTSAKVVRYVVRAYDVKAGHLLPGAIADRREEGPMTGSPITRATTRDGRWAYTLYARGNGTAFVHALDTVRRKAVCVDLPWKHADTWIWDAHLRLSRDETRLLLRSSSEPGADIDTRTWKVKTRSVF